MAERYRVAWAPVALEDLEEILDYLAVHAGAAVAGHVGDKLLTAIDTLCQLS